MEDGDGQEWHRPGPTRQQQWRDVWLGLAIVAGAVVTTLLVNSMGAFVFGTAPTLPEQIAWAVALTAPLMLRRRFPIAVLIVVAAVFIAAQARKNGDNLFPSLALFVALYNVGAWSGDRVLARWVRVGVIFAMFAWLAISFGRSLVEPIPPFEGAAGPLHPVLAAVVYQVGFNMLFFVAGYVFGEMAWLSARRRHLLEVRAKELRHSQELNARHAVVAERMRIARDLHDIVAHHVSVMGIQAAAARRVLDSDRERARTALSTVEQTAGTAVDELRGLLAVLRAESTDGSSAASEPADTVHPSSPGLEQIPELVAEVRATTGLRIEYGIYGDARPVPDAVALSAYRVVQEALTNTVKHAGASHVDVRVRFLEQTLEIEVTDDGRVRPVVSSVPEVGSGLGLVGMRERVAVHGGELETGPRRGGGYRVRARFPLSIVHEGAR